MKLQSESTWIELLDCKPDILDAPMIQDARLVYVNGNGKLKTKSCDIKDDYHGYSYISHMCLNDIPLIQMNAPACPTCEALLATGYGIQNASCKELQDVRNRINEPFVSLEKSIEDMEPILTLLETGLYVVADALCYPSDGNGNFFWNVPNNPVRHPATSSILLPEADYACVSSQPVYLYPTQDTNFFDETQTEHYIDIFNGPEENPRAIAYNFTDFISYIIDGHHKACAAAILGELLNCILIIPLQSIEYEMQNGVEKPIRLCFSSVAVSSEMIPKEYIVEKYMSTKDTQLLSISKGQIIHRKWSEEYIKSVHNYPDVVQFAEMLAFELPFNREITDEQIENAFEMNNELAQNRMIAILTVMQSKQDCRLKETAMKCVDNNVPQKVLVAAYRALATMRNDQEIEDVFINHLIDHSDKHDVIFQIINSYWS